MTEVPTRVLSALTTIPAAADASETSSAVLVLPGGGYEKHADHEAEIVGRWFATVGIHAFVLGYRVAPARHPAPLEDAKESLIWIRKGSHGLNVDAERVGVVGFSAGGHLAAMLAVSVDTGKPWLDTPESVPDFSILGYPVISFVNDVHQGSVDNLAGPGASPAQRRKLSAELHVSTTTSPAFLWHTADDGVVPLRHSLAYLGALNRAGVPGELHVFPQGLHGLGLAEGSPGPHQWLGLCIAWLERGGIVCERRPSPSRSGRECGEQRNEL